MYSFVTLDDQQKHDRRLLLDRYGFIAQLSVVLPLLVLQAHFLLQWLQARVRGSSSAPSSPTLKRMNLKDHGSLNAAVISWNKFLWWCGDKVSLLGVDLGTRGEILGAAVWTSWLLLLSILQTGDDYLHLTKRFGIVAASQLPFHYLLAVKTPYSPLQALTHASHETLNAAHQGLGRIVTALMYAHVILYLNFYVQSNLLAAKLQEAYVICGLVAIICFTMIGTSSLSFVRKASYRVFLAVHIILSLAVLPILFFHVSHIRIYLYETAAVLLLNVLARAMTASTLTAAIKSVADTQLVEVSTVPTKTTLARWLPGQHAYLSLPGQGIRAAISKNPFTVSSVPAVDNKLKFVARVQSGNTAALAKAARSGDKVEILLEGPYGVATHANTLLAYDRVLMIAGGIGGTFIMPLFRQLLSDLSPSRGSYRRQKVGAVWITRSSKEVLWAMPEDEKERLGVYERLQVFVTQPDESASRQDTADLYDKLDADQEDGIELEEQAKLISKASSLQNELSIYQGRPNLTRLIDQAFSSPHERIAVVVCGPVSLGRDVRTAIGRWVYRGRDVWFWNEHFSL